MTVVPFEKQDGGLSPALVARDRPTRDPAQGGSKPFPVPWPVIAASVTITVGVAIGMAMFRQVDIDVYRMGGALVFGPHLYSATARGTNLPFTYPPFAALVFWPFSAVPPRLVHIAWSLVNVTALGALIATCIRAGRPELAPARLLRWALLLLAPAFFLNPVLTTTYLGQINIVIVLLVMVDMTTVVTVRGRQLPRGVLLGLAAAVKLTPLIFIPLLLVTKQPRAARTAIITFAACTLGSFALVPQAAWAYWGTEVFSASRTGNLLFISDQNLKSAVLRMAHGPVPPALVLALTIGLALVGLAVAAWAYRRSSPTLGVLVCAATGLMVSPVSWSHHYVWALPLVVWLALSHDRPRWGMLWAGGAAALFLAAPIWWIPNHLSGYGNPLELLAGNSFFWAALALVLAVAVLLTWRRRRTMPEPSSAHLSPPAPRGAAKPLKTTWGL